MNKAKILGIATLIILTVTALATVNYSLQQQTALLQRYGVYQIGYWYTQIASVNLRNLSNNVTWQAGNVTVQYFSGFGLFPAEVGLKEPYPSWPCWWKTTCNQNVILILTLENPEAWVWYSPTPMVPTVTVNGVLNFPLQNDYGTALNWHLYIYLATKI